MNELEEQDIKIDYMTSDVFGQESRLVKTFKPCVFEDTTEFKLLVSEFKKFLMVAGYSKSLVDTLKIIDEK